MTLQSNNNGYHFVRNPQFFIDKWRMGEYNKDKAKPLSWSREADKESAASNREQILYGTPGKLPGIPE